MTTKYKTDNNLHKTMMFKVLTDVFSSSIKNEVAFKGGTLCYFLYNLPRFSVDLDFDYFGKDLEDLKLKTKKILTKYGNIIQETNTKLILKYHKTQIPLKVEYNTRISKNDHYEIVQLFGESIRVMRKDCIVSNKMIAQTQRHNKIARRDLFDIWFFLKQGFEANLDLIKEKTNMTYLEYINYLILFIKDNFNNKNVLEGFGEVLDEKQKYWVKTFLIDETIGLLQLEIFKQRSS